MKPKLPNFLTRLRGSLLLSVFAIGFGFTLLSLAVMISNANAAESYCREFQTKVTVAGKEESADGTVCRGPDGAWKIQPEGSTNLARTVIVPLPIPEAEPFEEDIIVLEKWGEDDHSVIILEEEDHGDVIILD